MMTYLLRVRKYVCMLYSSSYEEGSPEIFLCRIHPYTLHAWGYHFDVHPLRIPHPHPAYASNRHLPPTSSSHTNSTHLQSLTFALTFTCALFALEEMGGSASSCSFPNTHTHTLTHPPSLPPSLPHSLTHLYHLFTAHPDSLASILYFFYFISSSTCQELCSHCLGACISSGRAWVSNYLQGSLFLVRNCFKHVQYTYMKIIVINSNNNKKGTLRNRIIFRRAIPIHVCCRFTCLSISSMKAIVLHAKACKSNETLGVPKFDTTFC